MRGSHLAYFYLLGYPWNHFVQDVRKRRLCLVAQELFRLVIGGIELDGMPLVIFALRRLDVLATGDLGVRMAIRKAYQLEELPLPKQMEELAARWRPYSSVAVWYLWRSLEGAAQI